MRKPVTFCAGALSKRGIISALPGGPVTRLPSRPVSAAPSVIQKSPVPPSVIWNSIDRGHTFCSPWMLYRMPLSRACPARSPKVPSPHLNSARR